MKSMSRTISTTPFQIVIEIIQTIPTLEDENTIKSTRHHINKYKRKIK